MLLGRRLDQYRESRLSILKSANPILELCAREHNPG